MTAVRSLRVIHKIKMNQLHRLIIAFDINETHTIRKYGEAALYGHPDPECS